MKKSKKSFVILLVIATAAAAVSHYIMLPALNPADPEFFSWLFIVSLFYTAAIFLSANVRVFSEERPGLKGLFRSYKPAAVAALISAALFVVPIVLSIAQAPLFRSGTYKNLIQPQNGDFAADVAEISMSQIPVVDKSTAEQLGKRKLGEISTLVSQFEIASDYVQINYRGSPTRVTPLLYADFFKWLNNRSEGLPAYILVDMVTQETSLVTLTDNMRYSPSEYFGRDLKRYVRYLYPTAVFDEFSFEIDDTGRPFWVVPVIRYRVFPWGGKDIRGVILVDPADGKTVYYDVEEAPQWIDQVYDSDIIIEQLTWNGMYQSGFINAHIGQRGVIQPTDGYNYIAIDDDVFLYTGMTSIVSDESNVGFVLVNMRTKETLYYAIPGAEEYSAMDSAEGQVQHLGYNATFPLLLNIGDRPTYFVSLKDAAGLVKLFAFVDYERYQIVATGSTVSEAMENYITVLRRDAEIDYKQLSVSGTVTAIQPVVVDGDTWYYMTLTDGAIYTAKLDISPYLPFILPGDKVTIGYTGTGEVRNAVSLERTAEGPVETE